MLSNFSRYQSLPPICVARFFFAAGVHFILTSNTDDLFSISPPDTKMSRGVHSCPWGCTYNFAPLN